MATRYKDNTGEFINRLRGATLVGLRRAAIFAHAECRKEVNISAKGVYRRRVRDTTARGGGPVGSQYTSYLREHGADPSESGEPPHLRTGIGKSNVVWEDNGSPREPRSRVGVAKAGMHMIFLELGTLHIKPRPWLLSTVLKHWGTIGTLAAIGGKHVIE